MRIFLIVPVILIVAVCCSNVTAQNDGIPYHIKVQNNSSVSIIDISIQVFSFDSDLPNSMFLEIIQIDETTDKYTLYFDRTAGDIGATLAASFEGSYTQNNEIKHLFIGMPYNDSDYVTVIIDEDGYSVEEN